MAYYILLSIVGHGVSINISMEVQSGEYTEFLLFVKVGRSKMSPLYILSLHQYRPTYRHLNNMFITTIMIYGIAMSVPEIVSQTLKLPSSDISIFLLKMDPRVTTGVAHVTVHLLMSISSRNAEAAWV